LREEAEKREIVESEAERRFWQGLARGEFVVTLPSEAEWEKAARGALTPLPGPPPSPASGRGGRVWVGGEGSSRRYPWGDEPDPERANCRETEIGTTSAVGCFPGGASPYGVEDLSGNVWEWTRSLYRDYPYRRDDGREDLRAEEGRVARGGSWINPQGVARCAYRFWDIPDLWSNNLGFRVVVSLALQGSDS
jgi:formylglycine-generating enzyme required for sulfatase activity